MKIELCAASIEAIQLAKEFSFDRIELCQSLEHGGITPSYGLIEYAVEQGVEVHVLIRPRSGGFVYNAEELDVMSRNILVCKSIGVKGVVIGSLNENATINVSGVEALMKDAGEMDVTFHRAFDDLSDVESSIDQLIDLGVKRILSSGTEKNVIEGLDTLRRMKEHANSRIEIMPGGGVTAENIRHILDTVQPDGIHFSGTIEHMADPQSMFSDKVLKVDHEKVKQLLSSIR